MRQLPAYEDPRDWLDHIYSSQIAQRGGVVRRRVRDVERIVGRALFFEDLRRRGYQAIENNGHFVVFCNMAPLCKVV